MIKVEGMFITETGSCVKGSLTLKEDYTMNDVVREVKRKRYTAFCLSTMKRFVNI